MTLIAHTLKHNTVFFISDILVSKPKHKDGIPTVFLPSISKFSSFIEDPNKLYFAAELCQKTSIITENICFSFAGDFSQIQNFAKEMKMRFVNYGMEPTRINIDALIEEYKSELNKTSICISVRIVNKNGFDVAFHTLGKWLMKDLKYLGYTRATGSGANEFIDLFYSFDESEVKNEYPIQNDIHRQLLANMFVCTNLFGNESIYQTNFKNNWGGGYEITRVTPNGFIKVNKITYLILHHLIQENEPEELHTSLVLNYQYEKEVLKLSSWSDTRGVDAVYIPDIFSIDDPNFETYSDNPNFDTDILCVYLMFYGKDKILMHKYALVYFEDEKNKIPITLQINNRQLNINISDRFKEILKQIQ